MEFDTADKLSPKEKEGGTIEAMAFDWDDTVISYIPREQILHVVHTILMEKSEPDFEINEYFSINRTVGEWKDYLQKVQNLSLNLFGDKDRILNEAARFVRTVETEKGRTKIVKGLGFEDNPKQFWESYRVMYEKNGRQIEEYLQITAGFDELTKILQERNIKMFVISNTSSLNIKPTLDLVEKETGSPIFEEVVCLRDMEDALLKPNSSALVDIMESRGIDRGKTMYVGNTIEDIMFAIKSGVTPVVIGGDEKKYKELLPQAEFLYFRDFRGLLTYLLENNKI